MSSRIRHFGNATCRVSGTYKTDRYGAAARIETRQETMLPNLSGLSVSDYPPYLAEQDWDEWATILEWITSRKSRGKA